MGQTQLLFIFISFKSLIKTLLTAIEINFNLFENELKSWRGPVTSPISFVRILTINKWVFLSHPFSLSFSHPSNLWTIPSLSLSLSTFYFTHFLFTLYVTPSLSLSYTSFYPNPFLFLSTLCRSPLLYFSLIFELSIAHQTLLLSLLLPSPSVDAKHLWNSNNSSVAQKKRRRKWVRFDSLRNFSFSLSVSFFAEYEADRICET